MTFHNNKNNCINCTCKVPLFKGLTPDELVKVNAHRYEIFYHAGEIIFKQGSPATHVLSFTRGLAKLTLEDNGKNLFVGIIKPGAFIAGSGMHLEKRHHFTITALADSKVCAINQGVFIDILRNNQKFLTEYLNELNEAYIDLVYRLAGQTHKQARGKVADAILYLSDAFYGKPDFRIQLSTRDIAEMSGVSKESAARTLKEFSQEKIIAFNRQEMNILNLQQLKEISKVG